MATLGLYIKMIGQNMNSSRIRLYGATARRTRTTFSLLGALGVLMAFKTRKSWFPKLTMRKCHPPCRTPGYHTHHLSPLGRWHYVYRYQLWSAFVPDFRPQPPAGETWFKDYVADWKKQYPGLPIRSCWVRDEKGFWVWVTDTPGFDRVWFDQRGWQFPAKWIATGSMDFYTVGHDDISTVVSIETQVQGGLNAEEDDPE